MFYTEFIRPQDLIYEPQECLEDSLRKLLQNNGSFWHGEKELPPKAADLNNLKHF